MRPGAVPNAWFGLIPVLGVLVTILVTFFLSGAAEVPGSSPSPFRLSGWKDAFAAVQDSTSLLVLAGLVGTMLALSMSVVARKLTLLQSLGAWWSGARSLGIAVALLVLAIALRKVTDGEHLDSARYVLAMLSGTTLWLVPLVVFLAAAGIAFATGTSWGTMGILLPFAVPLAAQAAAESGQPMLLLLATGAVLDGAVFGDHCSPISDTTVLSSIGSSCDLMDHVKTQAPYAVAAMVVAGLVGYLGIALGWWASGVAWLLGGGILFVLIRFVGRKAQ
jgi:Na+/H+ antiporter NhaC